MAAREMTLVKKAKGQRNVDRIPKTNLFSVSSKTLKLFQTKARYIPKQNRAKIVPLIKRFSCCIFQGLTWLLVPLALPILKSKKSSPFKLKTTITLEFVLSAV